MTQWAAKTPSEVRDYTYDWSDDLAAEQTLVSFEFVPEDAAGTTVVATDLSDTIFTAFISGGMAGQTASYTLTVTTDSVPPEVFEDTVTLPILEAAVPEAYPGGYVAPTAASLIGVFPEFAAVPATTIEFYLMRAARVVDESWPEADFGYARMLLAAHLMTLAGKGATAFAQAVSDGSDQFRSMRIGSLALERFDKGSGKVTWTSTRYGREFLPMLRAVRGGPRVTGAGLVLHDGDGDHFGPWTQ